MSRLQYSVVMVQSNNILAGLFVRYGNASFINNRFGLRKQAVVHGRGVDITNVKGRTIFGKGRQLGEEFGPWSNHSISIMVFILDGIS